MKVVLSICHRLAQAHLACIRCRTPAYYTSHAMCQEKSIDCVFAGHLQFKTNCGAMAAITWQDKMRAMRGIIQGWGREEAVVRNHIARARARVDATGAESSSRGQVMRGCAANANETRHSAKRLLN